MDSDTLVTLGRLRVPTAHDFDETLAGLRIETVGKVPVIADPEADKLTLTLPLYGRKSAADPLADALRLRRQARALIGNAPLCEQGLYLAVGFDPDQDGWLVVSGGTVKDSAGGATIGDFLLELSDAVRIGKRTTRRPGIRIDATDRRLTTTPRDYLGTIFSADFAAIPNLLVARIPVGASDPLFARNVQPTFNGYRGGATGGSLVYTGGGGALPGDVLTYELDPRARFNGDVVLYDRRGRDTFQPAVNEVLNPALANSALGTYGYLPADLNPTLTRTTTDGGPIGAGAAMRVTPTTTGDSGVQIIGAETSNRFRLRDPSKPLHVIPYVKTNGGTRDVYCKIAWRNAGGALLSESNQTITQTVGSSAFQRLAFKFDAPNLAVFYEVTLIFLGVAPGNITTLAGTVIANGPLTAPDYFDGDTPGFAWTAAPGASASIAVGRANRMSRPSFEAGLTGWTSGGALSLYSGWSPDGRVSLRATGARVANDVSVFSPPFVVYQDETVTARLKLNVLPATDATGNPPRIVFQWDDGTLTYAVGTTNAPIPPAWTHGEQELALTATVPAGARQARLRILGVAGATAETVDFAIDEVFIGNGPLAELPDYFDGEAGGYWLGTIFASPSVRDFDAQDDLGWDELYGPDAELVEGDVPVLSNGHVRVRFNASPLGLRLDSWGPAGGWIEQGAITIYGWDGTTATLQDTLQSARVVEWTPERGVVLMVTRGASGHRCETYISLARGDYGPRLDVYTTHSNVAASRIAYTDALDRHAAIWSSADTAGAVAAPTRMRSSAEGSAGNFTNGDSMGSITTAPWLAFQPDAHVIVNAATLIRQGSRTAIITPGRASDVVRPVQNSDAYGASRRGVSLSGSAPWTGAGIYLVPGGYNIEAELYKATGAAISVVTDANAAGGSAVETTATSATNAVVVNSPDWEGGDGGLFGVWVRARLTVNGDTGQLNARGGTDTAVTSNVAVSSTSWTWYFVGTVQRGNGTQLEVRAWRSAGTGAVRVDRVLAIPMERRDVSRTHLGGSDLAQAALYDVRQRPQLIER